MSGERGQAALEAIVVVPMLALCGLTIAGAGLYGREVPAVSHAAGRAGAAAVRGEDVQAAASKALPAGLADGVRVDRAAHTVTVAVPTHAGMLTNLLPDTVAATVTVDAEVSA